jgi:hypothetical protein
MCLCALCALGPGVPGVSVVVIAKSRQQAGFPTPGNFGGGSTGPDQIFLGITRARSSAPGRGRAQKGPALCGETQTPRPQSTRQHESSSRSRGFLLQQSTGGLCRFGWLCLYSTSKLRTWFLGVVHRPAVLKGNLQALNLADHNEVSPTRPAVTARSPQQILLITRRARGQHLASA